MPKISFNTDTKEILITATPDAEGVIDFDVQIDLYSDGKEMWLADSALQKFEFPVKAEGGNITAAGTRGTLYTLLAPWKIRLGDHNQEVRYSGALVTSDGSRFWEKPITPGFTVAVVPTTLDNAVYLKPDTVDISDDLTDMANYLMPHILGSARFWGVKDEA